MPVRYTLKDMQLIARDHGGKCLSKEYIDTETPLAWMCERGHTWDSPYSILRQGGWCVQCSKGQRLEVMQEFAKEKGGKCLSTVYINSDTKLKWGCNKGHTWDALYGNMRHAAAWCRQCARKEEQEKQLEKLIKLAKAKGGKCLSIVYIDKVSKLQWQCSNGHTWYARGSIVRKRDWCYQCTREKFRQKNFKAFQKFAEKKGGKLLSGQFIDWNLKLKWRCSEGHVWEADAAQIKNNRTWCPYCAGKAKHTLDEACKLAQRLGGKCLSSSYINSLTNLKWQCAYGHVWMACYASTYNRGSWCPKCAGKLKHTISEMKALAISRGGKCLSSKYVNSLTKLRWQCRHGHEWEAIPSGIIGGYWCGACADKVNAEKRRNDISIYQKIAKDRGGKLLSKEYINISTHMTWQCSKGHTWQAKPGNVQNDHNWCPYCAGSKKHTIEDMRKLAKKRGGKCLSSSYVNNKTKLKWQCSKGHVWMAKSNDITTGYWCRQCGIARMWQTRRKNQRLKAATA